MTIRRDSIDTGQIDFSDEPGAQRLTPVHPGDVLKHDYLEPMGLSVYGLAAKLCLPRSRLNDIVLKRRAVTAETALRLARYLGTTPDFWMGLQSAHDLEVTRLALGDSILSEVCPRAA